MSLRSHRKLVKYALVAAIASLNSAAYAALPCVSASKLPAVSGTVVNVATDAELQNAVSNQQDNMTILLQQGVYNLSSTLYIRKKNVTIRGNGSLCDKVILAGKGMENSNYGSVPHGIWSDAISLSVMNLTIKDVYYHGIVYNSGAQSPLVDSVQLLNTGQQFIKSNPTSYGVGVDNGTVKNSRLAYENGPPMTDHGGGTGYTNGVDVHAGKNWVISGNYFENFHTPDSATNLWNPAILMWNGAAGTLSENNVFINVDRAIAYGLIDRSGQYDHSGGIIRNNMIYYASGLFSTARTYDSDGAIIVWNSPGTAVAHNTILSNGNLNRSIEFRFDTTGAQALNNLADVSIGSRNSAVFTQTGNIFGAKADMFAGASTGNLRLVQTATAAINKVNRVTAAPFDIDGNERIGQGTVDAGASEYGAMSPPSPPINPTGQQI